MAVFGNFFLKKGQQSKLPAPESKPTSINLEEEDQEEEDKSGSNHSSKAVAADEVAEETYEVLEREIHPAKIICPDCGGITLEGLEFCDKCGGELQ